MRFDGRLKSWNDERGFGFIEPLQGGQEIFVHIKAFPAGTGRPAPGLPLSFEIEPGPQGRKRATSVQFVRTPRPAGPRPESPARWSWPRRLVLPVFVLVYAAVAWRWPVSPWVAAAYLLASVVTFAVYANDKSAARHGRRRTRESTLHGLGLACGWPGALLAQQLLRHKTAKPGFVVTFWATVVLSIGGFLAVHLPWARRWLAGWIAT